MTIEYALNENDYLTHQLFIASKSERIRKRKQRNKWLIPLVYIVIALIYLYLQEYTKTVVFILVALFWFFLYPLWENRYYLKYYKGFISEHFKDKMGRVVTLEINNDHIVEKDGSSENKIATTEIKEIDEIATVILIILSGGQAIILPKNKIRDYDALVKELKELAARLAINYDIDRNWKWK